MREWTVFPFLFRLKAPEDEQRIQIDWEHEEWGWHDPNEVIRDADTGEAKLNGVPRLAESLRRVWFETDLGPAAAKALADGLDALAHDYESGARQMASAALQTLRGVVASLDAPDDGPTDGWWVKVRFAAWHLWKNGRESMGAAIMSALVAALSGLEEVMAECHQPEPWRDAILAKLDSHINARHDSAKQVSQAFSAYLKRAFPSRSATCQAISILTLSESSTIRQALQHAALESGFVLDLRVLESRPLYEGVSLAGSIAESLTSSPSQHKIMIYSDASAAVAAQDVDVVVIGADRIASSGSVSNKTGSLPTVLSAKHVCPAAEVVMLGESDKVAPPGPPEEHVIEDNDHSQVSRAWDDANNTERVRNAAAMLRDCQPSTTDEPRAVRVEIRNISFEWVDSKLIDVYVTESGEWTRDDIARHSEKLRIRITHLFEKL